jgi:hypothetical protein
VRIANLPPLPDWSVRLDSDLEVLVLLASQYG